jgi:hypothetical protein
VTAIDYEEQGAGYQAGFSRLAASEGDKTDLVSYVPNPQQFLIQELQNALQDASKPIRQLLSQVDATKLTELQVAGLRLWCGMLDLKTYLVLGVFKILGIKLYE